MVADVPAFNKFLSGSSADWGYKTEPQSNACLSFEDKKCSYASGKVMGGTSTTNAMYYSRGNKYDYDNWAALGNPGWSYDEILQYFVKSEDNRDADVNILLQYAFFHDDDIDIYNFFCRLDCIERFKKARYRRIFNSAKISLH